MGALALPSTPAIRRITRKLLRQKLEVAEDAGRTGVEIGTGHLRLLLDSLDAIDPMLLDFLDAADALHQPQPTGAGRPGSTGAPHPVGTNR